MTDNALAVAPDTASPPDPAQTVTEATPSPGTSTEPVGAPDATPEPALPAEQPEAAKPQTRREKRIEELLVERRAAVEWGQAQAEKATRLEAEIAAAKAKPAAPATGGPRLEDFKDANEWAVKVNEWAAVTALETLERRQTQREAETEAQRAQHTFAQREAAAAKKHADYYEVTRLKPEEGGPSISRDMLAVIAGSEVGPDIAYHLATHPEESWIIAALAPIQQAAAIGRLEAKLAVTPAPAPAPTNAAPKAAAVTRAPEPPSPINAGGSSGNIDLETCSADDYMRHERARLKAERAAMRGNRR